MTHAVKLREACAFVNESVFLPALASDLLNEDAKHIIKDSAKWLPHFERIGDLYSYLNRCISTKTGEGTHLVLKAAGLKSYEEILPEFEKRFADWLSVKTQLTDFQVGKEYSSAQLVIFADRYEFRSGGILPIGAFGKHSGVLVKVNLQGPYPNSWIEPGKRLKYYLQSKTSSKSGKVSFNEDYQANRAIIDFPDVPISAFVRNSEGLPFQYFGLFTSAGVHREEDGSKWFELVAIDDANIVRTADEVEKDLAKRVAKSRRDSSSARKDRLVNAKKLPRSVSVIVKIFDRNPDVIAEVLERAKGVCECCGKSAPFNRKSDGTPYLEVHHKQPLSLDGDDSTENAVAICPNCHRREHYGTPELT